MTAIAQRLLEQVLELSSADRTQVVGQLLESLDDEVEDGVDEAWREEVGRRVRALDAGEVQPIPWSEAEAMIFGTDSSTS